MHSGTHVTNLRSLPIECVITLYWEAIIEHFSSHPEVELCVLCALCDLHLENPQPRMLNGGIMQY